MTEEQKHLYESNSALSGQKKSGIKWTGDDILKLANSSRAAAQQFTAYHDYVSKRKAEINEGQYTKSDKPDSKRLLELLDALAYSSKRKMGAIKLRPLENINSISAIKKLALEAQKRKLRQEAAQEARIRKERAAAAEAQQRVKIKLATDFLNAGNFSGATRACREAIESNPECSKAHYILFLAENGLKSATAFKSGKGTTIRSFEEFNAALECASDEEAGEYLSDLGERVKNLEELQTLTVFMEHASQYDIEDEEEKIVQKIYGNIVRDGYDLDTAIKYFDIITQNLAPDSPDYIEYNIGFGDKVLAKRPRAAQKYYSAALEYCGEVHGEYNEDEVKYKLFLAQSGVSDTAALIQKESDFTKMDETVFKGGCNEYAVAEICEQCCDCSGQNLITAEPLFEYAIGKLPQSKSKVAVRYLLDYTEQLIGNGYFDSASKQNERILGINKDCHEAYFNRVLINKKINNPLELVNYASSIFDDPDFYAATSAYAALNKEGNLYINIGDALVRADKKLKSAKCRKYVLNKCKLSRKDLSRCDSKISSYITEYEVQEADRKRSEREREEREKKENEQRTRDAVVAMALKRSKKRKIRQSWLLALPELILITVLAIAYKDPMKIFQFIHFGWLIAISVVSCLTFFIMTCVFYSKTSSYTLKAKGFRGFLTGVGYIVCFILSVIVSIYPHTVQVKNARQLQAIGNFNTAVEYHFEITQDIDLSSVKEFKSIAKLGASATIDGKGHTISNMNITKLRKIKLKDQSATYYGGTVTTKRYAAGFVALNNGTIKNITFVNCSVAIKKDDTLDVNRVKNGVHAHIAYGYNEDGNIENVTSQGSNTYNYYG